MECLDFIPLDGYLNLPEMIIATTSTRHFNNIDLEAIWELTKSCIDSIATCVIFLKACKAKIGKMKVIIK